MPSRGVSKGVQEVVWPRARSRLSWGASQVPARSPSPVDGACPPHRHPYRGIRVFVRPPEAAPGRVRETPGSPPLDAGSSPPQTMSLRGEVASTPDGGKPRAGVCRKQTGPEPARSCSPEPRRCVPTRRQTSDAWRRRLSLVGLDVSLETTRGSPKAPHAWDVRKGNTEPLRAMRGAGFPRSVPHFLRGVSED